MAPSTMLWATALLVGAAHAAPPLFESERVQLISADLDALSFDSELFEFGTLEPIERDVRRCKVYPGDSEWPSEGAWESLNELTDNRLLKPRPQAAPCYEGPEYDPAVCDELSKTWTTSYSHLGDPIEMMSPVYQGMTCLPPVIFDTGNCTMGGFPMYVINATTPKHIQAGVNFARNTGVRLVVKNTGHDFLGKSGGAESLSIWTHHFKDID